MKVKHPKNDIRELLRRKKYNISEYTRSRIEQSYDFIVRLLSIISGKDGWSALDIGCGSGFDTFAMGMYFDRVVAIDANGNAIKEAERIVTESGVSNINFVCGDVCRYTPKETFDFIYCNLVSHHLRSRVALVKKISELLNPYGILVYSEETEGYGPLEIHRAIKMKNENALKERLHQVINGFTGRPCFRFFLSGTMGPIVGSIGMRIDDVEIQRWNGMTMLERLICTNEGRMKESGKLLDMDYLAVGAPFIEMRRRFVEVIKARNKTGLNNKTREIILGEAFEMKNPYSPYLIILLMADIVLPFLDRRTLQQKGIEKLYRMFPLPSRSRERRPDWALLEQLDAKFLATIRKNAGLEGGLIED